MAGKGESVIILPMMRSSIRTQRWLVVALALLAFGLRMYHLTQFSFWQDEGLTPLRSGYAISEILTNRIYIQEAISKDTHPPLYYLIIHFTQRLFGQTDFAYRFPAVLAGILLVPLVFQLGKALNGPAVGLIAGLVAAINPLHVWYSQEARMYTLLALLATAATYALWRGLTADDFRRWLVLYAVLAGLAAYTHYTAIFLVLGQGAMWAWLLWQRGHRRLIAGGAVLALLLALPLIPFTLPRLFTGAEANYFFVPPWIMLQDVVHGFSLGLSVDFNDWGIKLLDLGTAILLVAGTIGPTSRRPPGLSRTLLLVFLLATVLGLMLGSFIKPMYQGARHIMIGSPAFLILIARGWFRLPNRPLFLAPAAGLFVMLAGPYLALTNLYDNPVYAKDDLRQLVEYLEMRAGERDVVVYNNAILMPLHDHYSRRTDLPVTALPVYPYLAGPDTISQIQALAERYERIWFVTDPPADGRDSQALVSTWLNTNLVRLERTLFSARNMLVEVVAYTTQPVQTAGLPAGAVAVSEEASGLAPAGWGLSFQPPARQPTLWLDLFWPAGDPVRPAPTEHQLRLALRGPDDQLWLDQNQSLLPLSPFPWPQSAGALARISYGLAIPPGTPPGDYELLLQSWSAGESAPDSWQTLGWVSLTASSDWPLEPDWPFAGQAPLRFDNGLALLGVVLADEEVRPGHPLPVSLYWQVTGLSQPAGDLRYQLDVVGRGGQLLRSQSAAPGPSWLAPADWPAGAIMVEHTGLYFPPETEPGTYRLRWQLVAGEQVVPGRAGWRFWSSDSSNQGNVTVVPWPLETQLPTAGHILQASFGPAIQLYGYDLTGTNYAPGETLDLTLYWQTTAVPEESYYVFVHLVGPDGAITSQIDRVPVDWLRPTTGWRSGEVLTDRYQLSLPASLPPGTYNLVVGLFNPDSGSRPPVTWQGVLQPDDQLRLAEVAIR
jgi:4-amino-4-deoxy-L-arabinose transferase-like glycosyltransferase